jgi:hypothetical protein
MAAVAAWAHAVPAAVMPAAFVVKDGSGQKLGYFYYEEEAGPHSTAKMLTKDEARRIAPNVTKLPECCEKKLAGAAGIQ